jgi:hypothetical protein
MTDINDMLNNLFGGQSSNIQHKENLRFSEEEHEQVKRWMASAEGKLALENVLKRYELTKAGLREHPEMYLLTSPYANGFALAYDLSISEKTFSNLFFAFGLRMLDLGYYRVSFDRTIREEGDRVKTTERQYFKPMVSIDPSRKTDQGFGNVSIEKDLVDDKLRYLKVLVTVYAGQHYRDARPFDLFINELFTV